ncbi:endonuclease/exonuclease/phosphatase family protein [Streptomyces tendae]|uniref:Endonuclease/exonuclease/phosphatase family protein n=1 Tax=Streptomyces tendae TaxID=1932 RepID=A0ABW7S2Y7_STRTE
MIVRPWNNWRRRYGTAAVPPWWCGERPASARPHSLILGAQRLGRPAGRVGEVAGVLRGLRRRHRQQPARSRRPPRAVRHRDPFALPHHRLGQHVVVQVAGSGTAPPGILVGDFNALPTAPESQPLQKAHTDAWAKSLHALGDGATYPAQSPTERIDLIYATRKVTPLVTEVLKNDPTASDHRPLLSKVLVKP